MVGGGRTHNGTADASVLAEHTGPAAPWAVTVIHSPDLTLAERQVPLDSRLCLGRIDAPDIDLVIDDQKMSRRHATIQASAGGGHEVVDHESRNGTFVDGVRRQQAPIAPGAIVRVGDTLLEIARLPPSGGEDDAVLVGRAPAFRAVLDEIQRVARSSVPVLVLGPTGTGKDVVARRLHERSGRPGAFVAVNCGAIPADLVESSLFGHRKGAFTGATTDAPGFFGSAEGGTLFLDEVGELPLRQQSKLLRVLENREYTPVGSGKVQKTDVRIIAATNSDLEAEAEAGTFRNDLYARLAGVVIEMPPLRSRRSDIPRLIRHFLAELAYGRRINLSASAMERLLIHPWPRNIRELRTVVQRLTLLLPDGGEVSLRELDRVLSAPAPPSAPAADDTPPDAPTPSPHAPRPDRFDRPPRDEVESNLRRLGGNISKLAEYYGKNSTQIYRWLKRYGITPDSYRK